MRARDPGTATVYQYEYYVEDGELRRRTLLYQRVPCKTRFQYDEICRASQSQLRDLYASSFWIHPYP